MGPASHGLRATYFNDQYFAGPAVVLGNLSAAHENYGEGSPDPRIAPGTFSAVIEGSLAPEFSEQFTFRVGTASTGDGLAVRIVDPRNGRVLIDYENYEGSRPAPDFFQSLAGAADLEAGVKYLIRLRFTHGTGGANYRLGWESLSTPLQVIPTERLSPPPSPAGPKVAGGFVNNRTWAQPFRDYLTSRLLGEPAFGYRLRHFVDGGSLPWSGVDEVSLRFDRPVRVEESGLAVRGADGSAYGISGFRYDADTLTATWTLARPINEPVRLELDDGAVRGEDESVLDGEWFFAQGGVGPWLSWRGGSFPSGDGSTGGDLNYRINPLPGDGTSNGVVNAYDAADVRRRLGTRANDVPNYARSWDYSPFSDFNGDGVVNGIDLATARRRQNTRLPDDPPAIRTIDVRATSVNPTRVRPLTRSLFSDTSVLG